MYRILQAYFATLIFWSLAFGNSPTRLTIKNNTGSIVTITDIGRDIAASATEGIDLRNVGDFAASSDIDTLINADTIDILLDTVVLSNADAKELIHSRRLFKLKDEGSVGATDVTEIDFVGDLVDVIGTVVTIDSDGLPPFTAFVDYQYVESEAESTTSSDIYQEKVSLVLVGIVASDYRIAWSSEIKSPVGNNRVIQVRIEIDDTTTINETISSDQQDDFNVHAGFKKFTFTAGNHDIDLDFRRGGPSGTATIRRARIEIWRLD